MNRSRQQRDVTVAQTVYTPLEGLLLVFQKRMEMDTQQREPLRPGKYCRSSMIEHDPNVECI